MTVLDGTTLWKVEYVPSGWKCECRRYTLEGFNGGQTSGPAELMCQLHELTHHQWLYRNATVHMKVKDGMTAAQHNLILSRMEECLLILIDPADLLVEDRQLLDANFNQLTCGPTLDKLEWLAEMDSARGAENHVSKGSRHALRSRYCSGPHPQMMTEYEDVLVDRDRSLKWWRRRKR